MDLTAVKKGRTTSRDVPHCCPPAYHPPPISCGVFTLRIPSPRAEESTLPLSRAPIRQNGQDPTDGNRTCTRRASMATGGGGDNPLESTMASVGCLLLGTAFAILAVLYFLARIEPLLLLR